MYIISDIGDRARSFFINQHSVVCNQKYDKIYPYSFHLDMVYSNCKKFINLIPTEFRPLILAAAYGHDAIEDARLSYNEIKDKFRSVELAEIIYLCTENRGRNRSERKSIEWFKDLNQNTLAVFIKLCDIMANSQYSFCTSSSMFPKHVQEYVEKVKPLLYTTGFTPIFDYLDKLYSL